MAVPDDGRRTGRGEDPAPLAVASVTADAPRAALRQVLRKVYLEQFSNSEKIEIDSAPRATATIAAESADAGCAAIPSEGRVLVDSGIGDVKRTVNRPDRPAQARSTVATVRASAAD